MKAIALLSACLAALPLGCSMQPPSAAAPGRAPYEAGQAEARDAIGRNRLCWKLYGQPAAHDMLFKRVLEQEYNVELLVVAGCDDPVEIKRNADGFNEVMKKAIVKRFGQDVIPLAEEKARRQFQEQDGK